MTIAPTEDASTSSLSLRGITKRAIKDYKKPVGFPQEPTSINDFLKCGH